MLLRVLRALGLVGLVLAGTLVFVGLLNATVYLEASVPDRDELPGLPAGLVVGDVTQGCGSGNCYLEFVVEGEPGASAESIRDRLPADECGAHSLIDRRPSCTGYEVRGEQVVGSVTIGKWYG